MVIIGRPSETPAPIFVVERVYGKGQELFPLYSKHQLPDYVWLLIEKTVVEIWRDTYKGGWCFRAWW